MCLPSAGSYLTRVDSLLLGEDEDDFEGIILCLDQGKVLREHSRTHRPIFQTLTVETNEGADLI